MTERPTAQSEIPFERAYTPQELEYLRRRSISLIDAGGRAIIGRSEVRNLGEIVETDLLGQLQRLSAEGFVRPVAVPAFSTDEKGRVNGWMTGYVFFADAVPITARERLAQNDLSY